jgi:PKD repeat protein
VHTYQNLGTYTVKLIGTGTGGSDTYTITDAIKVTSEVIIEAETITNFNGYLVDNVNGGGQMIQVDATQTAPYTGTATIAFPGATGTYNITLFGVPENDGTPTVRLYINGTKVIEQVMPQHADYYNLATRLEYTASNIMVNKGDEIKIEGISNSGAYARVDKIIFSATNMSIDNRQLTIDKRHQMIRLMPNPMRDVIWFNTITKRIDQLTIYDNTGNTIYNDVGAIHGLPLRWCGTDNGGHMVKPGVYYYELRINGYIYSGRIIKL